MSRCRYQAGPRIQSSGAVIIRPVVSDVRVVVFSMSWPSVIRCVRQGSVINQRH